MSPILVLSSLLFFVPGIICFFRQSLMFTIAFCLSGLFSSIYHFSGETKYVEVDVLWANIAVLFSLMMLAITAMHYPIWNWRVCVPLILGVAGLTLYFVGGTMSEDTDRESYVIYHSLWHVLIAASTAVLSWTPVDLKEIQYSYKDLSLRIVENAK